MFRFFTKNNYIFALPTQRKHSPGKNNIKNIISKFNVFIVLFTLFIIFKCKDSLNELFLNEMIIITKKTTLPRSCSVKLIKLSETDTYLTQTDI